MKITLNLDDVLTLGLGEYESMRLVRQDGTYDKPDIDGVRWILIVRPGTDTDKQLSAHFDSK